MSRANLVTQSNRSLLMQKRKEANKNAGLVVKEKLRLHTSYFFGRRRCEINRRRQTHQWCMNTVAVTLTRRLPTRQRKTWNFFVCFFFCKIWLIKCWKDFPKCLEQQPMTDARMKPVLMSRTAEGIVGGGASVAVAAWQESVAYEI